MNETINSALIVIAITKSSVIAVVRLQQIIGDREREKKISLNGSKITVK